MIAADDILLLASHTGLLQDVELALSMGADVNCQHIQGFSVLHLAAIADHPVIVRKLVESGAILDALDVQGRTPLQLAIDHGSYHATVELIRRGSDVRRCWQESAETALHKLARTDQWNAIAEAIIAGADVNARCARGKTAAHIAAEESQARSLRTLMIGGADLSEVHSSAISEDLRDMVNAWKAAHLAQSTS